MKTKINQSPILKTILATLVAVSFVACSGQSFSSTTQSDSSAQSQSKQTQCEIDPVDYVVSANIYDFEMTDKANVSFGFNLLNNFIKALGLSIDIASGKMSLNMQITDPLHMATPLVNVNGTGSYSNDGFSGSVDLGKIGLNAGYYYTTPFATMTQNGLSNAFSSAVKKLSAVQLPWHTMVLTNVDDSTLVVGAGTLAGLKVGDQLALYNVNNIWRGAPCTSELLISQKTTATPIAIAQVTQVAVDASTVQIISRNSSETLDVGATAEISKLTGKNRVLNRAVRVGGVTSGSLTVINGQAIDLAAYAEQQIQSVITSQSFYIHQ